MIDKLNAIGTFYLKVTVAIFLNLGCQSSSICPPPRPQPRDVFNHPGNFVTLKCLHEAEEGHEATKSIEWIFNSKFGENWANEDGVNFNATERWSWTTNHSGQPPFVNSLGRLILGEVFDRKWQGEFLCIYSCDKTGQNGDYENIGRLGRENKYLTKYANLKHRTIWLTIYESQDTESHWANLHLLFGFICVFGVVTIFLSVFVNFKEVQMWKTNIFSERDRYTYTSVGQG